VLILLFVQTLLFILIIPQLLDLPMIVVLLMFTWDFGDGSAVSRQVNPSHVYTSPGKYITLNAVTPVVLGKLIQEQSV
jgi:hypothetical protein